jgi:serine/threonine protein kinase
MKRILSGNDGIIGRQVAIARLLSCDTADDLELFLREARITACLEHPNIMPVYDIALDSEGLPFFTMKLMESEDLKLILLKLKNGVANYSTTYRRGYLVEMFLKVCDAIAYAHSRGVLHLDLKPDNIKTSDFGEVIVCDWGLARLMDDADHELIMKDGVAGPLADISRTMNGVIKGTPGYMAPEQATLGKNLDVRTDIYSLGALLYSLLTYERSIDEKTTEEILSKTKNGDFLPPSQRAPQLKIPIRLEAVVMKAMATKPEERYQTVKELQDDVRHFVEGYATDAENAPFHKLVTLLFKRHLAWVLISLLTIIVIPVGSLIFLNHLEVNRLHLAEAKKQQLVETNKRLKLSTNTAEILYDRATALIEKLKYHEALDELKKSLKLNPTHPQALELKATILTGFLRFNKARETAKLINDYTNQYFISLADSYNVHFDANHQLTEDAFLRLLNEVQDAHLLEEQGDFEKFKNRISSLLFKQLTHTTFTHYPLKKRLNMLGEVLSISNPQSSISELEIITKGEFIESLNLGGDSEISNLDALTNLPIKNLHIQNTGVETINFLKKYPLEKLDLSNTKVHDLSPLTHLALKELNLSGTPVTDLSPIMKSPIRKLALGSTRITPLDQVNILPYLEILVLSKKVYSSEDRSKLESRIKVIFTD